jgi:hypothetical protein
MIVCFTTSSNTSNTNLFESGMKLSDMVKELHQFVLAACITVHFDDVNLWFT